MAQSKLNETPKYSKTRANERRRIFAFARGNLHEVDINLRIQVTALHRNFPCAVVQRIWATTRNLQYFG